MAWAQVFPFVALQLYDGDAEMKGSIMLFFICSSLVWVLLNVSFFCTIDLSFASTFYGPLIASQELCLNFQETKYHYDKFLIMFKLNKQFTKPIENEMREWLTANIEQFITDKPDWFNIELVPDEYLPRDLFEAEGGARRRRSVVSVREMVGLESNDRQQQSVSVHPKQ